METIENRIREMIQAQTIVEVTDLSNQAKLTADLDFDELDVVELVMSIEEAFEISISDVDGQKLESGTVQDVIDYVKKRFAPRKST